MSRRPRSSNETCPRCAVSQPVPLTDSGHECGRCSWEWRFAICGTCDILSVTLEYLESWRCEPCQAFNRSWWKTDEAERFAASVVERRQVQHAPRTGRWIAAGGLGAALLIGTVWAVIPRQSTEQREEAAAESACRRFSQLRRDEASGTLSRGALFREIESIAAASAEGSASLRDAAGALSGATRESTDSTTFQAAMTAFADACEVAAPEQ